MDDPRISRRGFLGKLATALAGVAAVPLMAGPALADRPYRRRGWVGGWIGRRRGQATVRRGNSRNYSYPSYRPPASVPQGYSYPAPRGGFPLQPRPASGWGGASGYYPPMLNRSPRPSADPFGLMES